MLSSVHAVRGYEERLNPLRYVTMLWGNDADVPAQKALWLASSATDGKSGLQLTVLTTEFKLARLFKALVNWLLQKPNELMELKITSVEPEISGD